MVDQPDFVEASPEPVETGTAGSQAPTSAEQSKALARIIDQPSDVNPFGAAIETIPEIRGAVAMQLAAAGYRQMASELLTLKERLAITEEALELWRGRYTDEHTRAEVLSSRLEEQPHIRRLQSFALAMGGVLLGLGLQIVGQNNLPLGALLSIAGALLMWMGATQLRRGD